MLLPAVFNIVQTVPARRGDARMHGKDSLPSGWETFKQETAEDEVPADRGESASGGVVLGG